jgi:hypothetical protein
MRAACVYNFTFTGVYHLNQNIVESKIINLAKMMTREIESV